ncbi:hypothetical protein [Fischerella sp. JS2]|uniref:hypothetical protein n=1 Tax=Fischerella sp. JS2 TaxID=2597771 RepID=UPI0028E4633A|nr:hypothetical protein [Fischerella sp. JS2]
MYGLYTSHLLKNRGRRQKAEGRRQKAEGRRQKAERLKLILHTSHFTLHPTLREAYERVYTLHPQ